MSISAYAVQSTFKLQAKVHNDGPHMLRYLPTVILLRDSKTPDPTFSLQQSKVASAAQAHARRHLVVPLVDAAVCVDPEDGGVGPVDEGSELVRHPRLLRLRLRGIIIAKLSVTSWLRRVAVI